MSDPKSYWVGFNLVKGIGAARLRGLLEAFGSVERAWSAPVDELRQAGLGSKALEGLLHVRSTVSLDEVWAQLQAQDIQVLTWADEDYPRRLMEVDQPPPVLYVRGSVLPEDEQSVAIVGTRRISAYGRQVAQELAGFLAKNGVTVISGLARGVDAVAHTAALDEGGRTLAVLGSGLNQVYPPENRALAARIMAQGALISDYPPNTPPDAANFPPRNRIISGLSRAIVVVEAGERSGALITAEFGRAQDRLVYAVPGSIYAPQCKGTNRLIQDGGRPLLNGQDLLAALNLAQAEQHRTARRLIPVDETEEQLFAVLSGDPLHVDEIGARANLPIEKVSAALTLMELKGMVRHLGGMSYVAVREAQEEYFT